MTNLSRASTYAFIVVIILGALIHIKAPISSGPQGIFLPASPTETAVIAKKTAAVKLYTTLPADAEVMGDLNAMLHFIAASAKKSQLQLHDYVLQTAAAHGANGVVINYFFITASGTPMESYLLHAQLIK